MNNLSIFLNVGNLEIGTFIIMLGITGVFIRQVHQNPEVDSMLPNVASTLGILGTFIGITMALLKFKVNGDINIEGLIESMRFAFITSILGMVFSLIMKAYQQILSGKTENTEKKKGVRAEFSLQNIDLTNEKMLEELSRFNRREDKKNNELAELMKLFSLDLKDAVDKALRDNISKITTQINLELGDSFRHVSNSVRGMVEWQENYKNILEKNIETQKMNQEKFTHSANILEKIAKNMEKINVVSENIEKITETLHEQNSSFGNNLSKVNEIGTETNKMIDNISSCIAEVKENLKLLNNEGKAFNELSLGYIEKQQESLDLLKNNSDTAVKEIYSAGRNILENTNQNLKIISENVTEALNEDLKGAINTFNDSLLVYNSTLRNIESLIINNSFENSNKMVEREAFDV